jgi:integrase
VKEAKIAVAKDERLSPHALRHTYTSHLIVGARARRGDDIEGRRGMRTRNVTMRVYADDFCKATERNAAVLARAAERGFGT